MSTRSAESRSNSPDGHDESAEKRSSKKRKVLSCYACRNRKMKCDRVYPVCGRCQKTGRSDQCTYDPRLVEDIQVNIDTHVGSGDPALTLSEHTPNPGARTSLYTESLSWKLRAQERRLEDLERGLARLGGVKDSSSSSRVPLDFNPEDAEPTLKETMMFRGKSFKTQFYGSTSPLTLINQFNELQTFTREAMTLDTTMVRARGDFKAIRDRRKAVLKENVFVSQGTDAEVMAIVPDKVTLDAATALYFRTFETSHRILHEPTFWRAYESFWELREHENPPVDLAVTLILITAATKSLSENHEAVFIGDSAAEREAASRLIDLCDAWLLRRSRKSLTLISFQLCCLSLLAKRANCIKMKQEWINSGIVMRMIIAAGMHRNPSLLSGGRITEYEKEMRRRLFATMAELELQSSLDHGLQSSLSGMHFDTQPPANVPDDAFSPTSTQVLVGRPLEAFTACSYLAVSMRSLAFRIQLTQLLNNPTTEFQYSDVLHYDTQITSLLSAIPSWSDGRAKIPSVLLDVQLQQFLLMLHLPYAKLAATNSRFSYSFTACVKAANSIITAYDDLMNKGIYSLNHIRSDIFRTGMSIAQVVYHNSFFPELPITRTSIPTSTSNDTRGVHNVAKVPAPPGPLRIPQLPTNDFMTSTLCRTSIELLNRASNIFENKVTQLGTGYMEFWLLSAAVGIMPSLSPMPRSYDYSEDLQSRGRKATDRTTRLCFRVLAMQKDPGNEFASLIRSTMANVSPPEIGNGSMAVKMPLTPVGSELSMQGVSSVEGLQSVPRLVSGHTNNGSSGGDAGGLETGAWDALQDFQVDISGWTFPDFWAFDMGGEF